MGLGGPRAFVSHQMKFTDRGVQGFPSSKIRSHVLFFGPLDLGFLEQDLMTSVTNTHNPASAHALVNS